MPRDFFGIVCQCPHHHMAATLDRADPDEDDRPLRGASLAATRAGGRARPASTASSYSIAAMAWGTVELEPEVRLWLEELPTTWFANAAFYIDLLAEQGPLLGEP
jgi:hypothetical protein